MFLFYSKKHVYFDKRFIFFEFTIFIKITNKFFKYKFAIFKLKAVFWIKINKQFQQGLKQMVGIQKFSEIEKVNFIKKC